jgi:predicted FMN-binding regulatory protein PaiB
MSALGAIAGRLKAGNVAFWTPQGVPGPNREDFVRGEVNVPIELTEIRSQTELSNKAVGHLAEVVQGLQSRMEQVPVVEDIKGTIEMGEREPDQIIDIAREKLMELI